MKLQYANLVSNFGSRLFFAISSFICIPIMLKFIGIEAYGLIGFFNILSTFFGLLDFGFTGALNREVASLSAISKNPGEIKNLVRSLEVIFWIMGGVIGVILIASVDFIASRWISPEHLTPSIVRSVLILMSISLVSQWPFTIYSNVLMGLEKQVVNNGLITIFNAARNFGGLFVLWIVNGNIEAYFLYQIGVNIVQTIVGMITVWKILPCHEIKARFDWDQLKKIKGYAAGMFLLALLSFCMMNMDKIILSRILSLDAFGCYILAVNFAAVLYVIISPIFATYFPRLTQLVALKEEQGLKCIYHESCQIMSVLLLPAALTLAAFAPEILFFWTRNHELTQKSYEIVRYLIIGTAFNGLMNIPYALQLAHGVTKYSIYQNIVSIALLFPLTIWMSIQFGVKGAILTWVIHNVGCILIMAPLFHYKFLQKEHRFWCIYDVMIPLMTGGCVVVLARWLFPVFSSIYLAIPTIGACFLMAIFASLMVTKAARKKLQLMPNLVEK